MASADLSPTKDIKSEKGKLPNQWTGEQKRNFIVEKYLKLFSEKLYFFLDNNTSLCDSYIS